MAQRCCQASICGNIQKLSGHNPGQLVLSDPAWAVGLDRKISSLTGSVTQEIQTLEKGKHLLHQSSLIQLAWKQSATVQVAERSDVFSSCSLPIWSFS